jgi:CheY-like chemotaxis protein
MKAIGEQNNHAKRDSLGRRQSGGCPVDAGSVPRRNRLIQLHVAADGVEAMAFLRREGVHIHAPRPDLVLLDLNLPKMDGREVLAQIKQDDDLKMIPTLILTTSEAEADIVKSYRLQANCYLNKPVRFDAFESLVKSINDFWLTRVKLPPQAPSG